MSRECRSLVQRAFRVARTGGPGRLLYRCRQTFSGRGADVFSHPVNLPRPSQRMGNSIRNGNLAAAERPLILAGGGIDASMARTTCCGSLRSGVPVLASFRRHDVFPNPPSPLCRPFRIGTFSGILDRFASQHHCCDGTSFSEVTTPTILTHQGISGSSISISSLTLGKVYPPEMGLSRMLMKRFKCGLDTPFNCCEAWSAWA